MNPSLKKWLMSGGELVVSGLGAAISAAIAAALANPEEYKLGSGKCAVLALYSFIVGTGLKLGQWLAGFHFNNGK